MIPGNELRVGNLVILKDYHGEGYETTAGSISEDGIDGTVGWDEDIHFDECWPIPLTDDRLLKFGFEQDRARLVLKIPVLQNCYFASSPYVGLIDGTTSVCLYHVDGKAIGRVVNFVHQLQNFFFALTGEELTIKETA